jgi:hypothetical protein
VATTRAALRQQIGRLTGDMLKCTATATGTTTTLIDAINLYRGDGSLEGRIGWFSAGTAGNLYDTVRVTGNTRSTFTVTFTPTLSDATATSDVLELWNERGQGYLPADVHSAINDAIALVGTGVTTLDDEEITDFDIDDPYLTIPAEWDYVGEVWFKDTDEIWHEIPFTPFNMEVNDIDRLIRLKGDAAKKADTCTVRLVGEIAEGALSSDTSSTTVNAHWLTHHVAYLLMAGGMRRQSNTNTELSTMMAFCKQEADKMAGRAMSRRVGAGIRLH